VNSVERPAVVARPIRGTRRFRRHCWVGVVDGALVAHDRRNRRYEFPLDGTETAPHSLFMFIPVAEPWETHFIDGRGESVVGIPHTRIWEGEMAIREAACLLVALLSGGYFGALPKRLKGRRAPNRPGARNRRKRRKRRLRRRG
jgi:hypothetical protein